MNRYKINILLLSAIIGFAYAKDSYTISGSVQNESGEAIKKGSVVLVNKTDGAETVSYTHLTLPTSDLV